MASLYGYVYSTYSNGTLHDVRWEISGLSEPASSYSAFRVSTTDGKFKQWSDGTTYDYTSGHNASGNYITGNAEALFNGNWYSAGSYQVYLPPPPPPPDTQDPSITNFFLNAINKTSIQVYASASDNVAVDQLRFLISQYGSTSPPAGPTVYVGNILNSSGYYTYSGLTPGYYYTVEVFAFDTAGNSSPHSVIYDVQTTPDDITPPTMTSFNVTSTTENSITVSASATDTGAGVSYIQYYISAGNSTTPSSTTVNYVGYTNGASGNYVFTGLASGMYYTVEANAVDASPQANFSPHSRIQNVRTTVISETGARTNATAIGSTQFDWFLSSLSKAFNSTNYMAVGIFNQSFANDSASQPPGLLSSLQAPASGNSTTTATTRATTGVSAGNTYVLYGGAKAANGRWYTAGSVTIKMRPDNWAWFTPKVAGQDFNITNIEWRDFTIRVNSMRGYKGMAVTQFATYNTGDDFTAALYNTAAQSVGEVSGRSWITKAAGDDVLASLFNKLRDDLNSVP